MEVLLGLLAVLGVGYFISRSTSAEQQQHAREVIQLAAQHRQRTRHPPPLSVVGAHTAAGELACPRCGGTAFRARRTTRARWGIATSTAVTLGAGALAAGLTPQSRVQCVSCGTLFERG